MHLKGRLNRGGPTSYYFYAGITFIVNLPHNGRGYDFFL